jgi:hypothetical protein
MSALPLDFVAKVENPTTPKISRKSILDIPIAARLLGADTKVRGRFCVKRYGPSRREAPRASAVLKISVDQPKNTFATKSVINGPDGPEIQLPLIP